MQESNKEEKKYNISSPEITRFLKEFGILDAWRKYLKSNHKRNVYSGKFIDHVFGASNFSHYIRENKKKGFVAPQLLKHQTISETFRAYLYIIFHDDIISEKMPLWINNKSLIEKVLTNGSIGETLREMGVSKDEIDEKIDQIDAWRKKVRLNLSKGYYGTDKEQRLSIGYPFLKRV